MRGSSWYLQAKIKGTKSALWSGWMCEYKMASTSLYDTPACSILARVPEPLSRRMDWFPALMRAAGEPLSKEGTPVPDPRMISSMVVPLLPHSGMETLAFR